MDIMTQMNPPTVIGARPAIGSVKDCSHISLYDVAGLPLQKNCKRKHHTLLHLLPAEDEPSFEEERASRRAKKVTASSGARVWQARPGSKHVVCL